MSNVTGLKDGTDAPSRIGSASNASTEAVQPRPEQSSLLHEEQDARSRFRDITLNFQVSAPSCSCHLGHTDTCRGCTSTDDSGSQSSVLGRLASFASSAASGLITTAGIGALAVTAYSGYELVQSVNAGGDGEEIRKQAADTVDWVAKWAVGYLKGSSAGFGSEMLAETG